MNNLLTINEQDILPDSPAVDTSGFRKRGAARAVLLDEYGQVYLLHVSKHGYHKLPGGGIDEGELAEGMFEIKAKSIDDAISLLSQDKPDNLEGHFIQKHDLSFLRAAKEQL